MAKRNEGQVLPDYILWTYSANKEGKHPVKIRITHQRNRKYYSVLRTDKQKVFLSPAEFEKISTSPIAKLRGDSRAMRSVLDSSVDAAREAIEKATNNGKTPFSFAEFEKRFLGADSNRNFLAFFKSHIDNLLLKGQAGTARAYSSAYSALYQFQNGRDFDPADLTVAKLQDFEQWLRKPREVRDSSTGKRRKIQGKNNTSISIYMRCIRSVFNELAAGDPYLLTAYPFSRSEKDRLYKMPISSGGQKARTMTKEELDLFISGKISGEKNVENPMYRAKQLFLFSLFAQGMNFKDMALLKNEDIQNHVIDFVRKKTERTQRTGGRIRIPIDSLLEDLLFELANPDKRSKAFVFGLFHPDTIGSEKEQDDKIRQWVKTTNKWLKRYCSLNNLSPISTYSSRHTFGSLAKASLPLLQISQMMGHNNLATTQGYTGKYNDDENKQARMKIFGGLSKKSA